MLTYSCNFISHNMFFSKGMFLPPLAWVEVVEFFQVPFTQGLFLALDNLYCTALSPL